MKTTNLTFGDFRKSRKEVVGQRFVDRDGNEYMVARCDGHDVDVISRGTPRAPCRAIGESEGSGLYQMPIQIFNEYKWIIDNAHPMSSKAYAGFFGRKVDVPAAQAQVTAPTGLGLVVAGV